MKGGKKGGIGRVGCLGMVEYGRWLRRYFAGKLIMKRCYELPDGDAGCLVVAAAG